MTSLSISQKTPNRAKNSLATGSPASNQWVLQDAKARFSELVRRVHSEGPQHVSVHGRDEVVVIAAQEFSRLKGSFTGQALIDALQSSPYRNLELTSPSFKAKVREVKL